MLVTECVNRQRKGGHHGKRVHSLAARRAVHCARRPLGLRYPRIGRRQKGCWSGESLLAEDKSYDSRERPTVLGLVREHIGKDAVTADYGRA
jgi:hypothetical protein